MKRVFLLLILTVFLCINSTVIFGQNDTTTPSTESLELDQIPPTGQQHNYSVLFRGNGQAIVNSRIAFYNSHKDPINEITLTIPEGKPENISVFQVLQEPLCKRYETIKKSTPSSPPKQTFSNDGTPMCRSAIGLFAETLPNSYRCVNPNGGSIYFECLWGYRNYNYQCIPGQTTIDTYDSHCAEYTKPNFYDYVSNVTYQKATVELNEDRLIIKLPRQIETNSSGSIIFNYSAFGYAHKKRFGAFDYEFQTFKVDDNIQQLTVGISTDTDLFLKGATNTINYGRQSDFITNATNLNRVASIGGAGPQAYTILNTYSSSIGTGSITKSISNLQFQENYTVKGSFADSNVKLYAEWILLFIAIFVAILLVILIVIIFVIKKMPELKQSQKTNIYAIFINILEIKGLSILSSLCIIVYTIGVDFITRNFIQKIHFNTFTAVLLLMLSFVVYGVCFFFPSYLVGKRRGAGQGIVTFIFTLIWLIIASILLGEYFTKHTFTTPFQPIRMY